MAGLSKAELDSWAERLVAARDPQSLQMIDETIAYWKQNEPGGPGAHQWRELQRRVRLLYATTARRHLRPHVAPLSQSSRRPVGAARARRDHGSTRSSRGSPTDDPDLGDEPSGHRPSSLQGAVA